MAKCDTIKGVETHGNNTATAGKEGVTQTQPERKERVLEGLERSTQLPGGEGSK